MIEIGIAFFENIQILAMMFFVVVSIASLVAYLWFKDNEKWACGDEQRNERERKTALVLQKIVALKPYLIISAIIGCIPCADHLWKVRLSLIKLELASPENVKATTDHIDRIAKDLECKYLNDCPKEKK
jgi:hypothetical protein